jgi:BirA family biotin operon repressor/biotin-[acetyl-CoA-carboxylase] ligase
MRDAAGRPAGSIVVAGEQTAGQGRHGHEWHSEAGAGLYCSMVLDLPLPPAEMAAATLALGVAAAEAIERVGGLRCDLRWPNDVMLGDRKVAGILVQFSGTFPVAGIGINVNHSSFPPGLAESATSLRLETGREFALEELLEALVAEADRACALLVANGRQAVIDRFTAASSYARGKRVEVAMAEGTVAGVTAGLDASGFLRLRRDDGRETLVLAGGVRAART